MAIEWRRGMFSGQPRFGANIHTHASPGMCFGAMGIYYDDDASFGMFTCKMGLSLEVWEERFSCPQASKKNNCKMG